MNIIFARSDKLKVTFFLVGLLVLTRVSASPGDTSTNASGASPDTFLAVPAGEEAWGSHYGYMLVVHVKEIKVHDTRAVLTLGVGKIFEKPNPSLADMGPPLGSESTILVNSVLLSIERLPAESDIEWEARGGELKKATEASAGELRIYTPVLRVTFVNGTPFVYQLGSFRFCTEKEADEWIEQKR